jgi:hypothetical protein
MALIRARSTETGEVVEISEAWPDRWPDDFVPLTEAELAAEQAELQRLAEQNAPSAPAVEQPAAAQPAASAPAPAAAPEQPAPRGRF